MPPSSRQLGRGELPDFGSGEPVGVIDLGDGAGDDRTEPPEHPPGSPIAFLYRAFDDMLAVLGDSAHTEELAEARRLYETERGRVFEDETLWEKWSQAFLEWYALEKRERPTSPAADYLAGLRSRPDAGDDDPGRGDRDDQEVAGRRAAALTAWLTSHRSLFEVRALRAGRVELLDILGGGWFAVAEQRSMVGVSVGDVAELRLVGFEGDVVFGRTFLFHPPDTREAIIAHADKMRAAGKNRFDIIEFCASLRIRCERYRHVSPRRVYEAASHDRVAPRTGEQAPVVVRADSGDPPQ